MRLEGAGSEGTGEKRRGQRGRIREGVIYMAILHSTNKKTFRIQNTLLFLHLPGVSLKHHQAVQCSSLPLHPHQAACSAYHGHIQSARPVEPAHSRVAHNGDAAGLDLPLTHRQVDGRRDLALPGVLLVTGTAAHRELHVRPGTGQYGSAGVSTSQHLSAVAGSAGQNGSVGIGGSDQHGQYGLA